MRTILRCLLLLLFASSGIAVNAQAPSFYRSTLDWAKAPRQAGPSIAPAVSNRNVGPAIAFPNDEADASNLRLAPGSLIGGGGAPQAAAICGPDTVFYPIAKASGFRLLRFADSLAFGQYYDAPQPITINGFSFYAYVDSSTNQTVTVTCRLYLAGADSLPTGNPLATANVTIDSNFYGGNLGLLEKYVSWPSVTVNSAYVVTIENNNPINTALITNDFAPVSPPRDGLQEWIGHIFVPGNGWLHGYQITIGGNPFDADVLLHPHVTYDVTANYVPNPASGCTNIAATLVNQSSPIIQNRMYNVNAFQGNPAASFGWNYGDGSPIDNVINGNHAYTTPGTYTIALTDSMIGWNVNCADVTTGTITIAPGAAIVANYSYTSAGLSANFTDGSTNMPVNWFWDFGDGNTSSLQNPNHTYASNGTYTVCLVASNACNTDTVCQTVLVGALPAANCDTITNITGTPTLYSATQGGYVAGHNFRLDSAKAERFTTGGNFAFQEALFFFGLKHSLTPLTSKVIATAWDATGTGGSPGAVLATQDLLYNNIDTTGALTSVTFPSVVGTNGPYSVGLPLIHTPGATNARVPNAIGQTTPATAWELNQGGTQWVAYDDTSTWGIGVSHAIFIVQTVEAAFSQATSGLTATFTDQSLGATGWQWDFGDGNTSNAQSPTHTYANPGTYTVCQIALNQTCVDTICQTVTVTGGCPNPTAAFTSTTSGLTTTFVDGSTSSTTITQWLWDFGDGNTSPQQNPSHTYAMPGTYNVCLTVTDSCGTDSTCSSVTITCPTLIASFQDTVIGLQIGVQGTSTGNPTSWLWDWGDGNTSVGGPQNFHTYAMAGVYTVCLTVSDSCSTDSTCQTVVIGCPIPIANFTFSTSGLVTNFTDQSTNLPTTWAWDFGDGNTSTLQNPTHTYATVDTFLVCLIASSTCGADTICDTIITGCNTPVAGFTSSQTNLQATFTDASTNTPTSWMWDFGDGNVSTLQNPTHVYNMPGTYTVCLTASSSCGSDSTCQTVTVVCPNPMASFTNTVNGLVVNFVDQSSGSPTGWLWDFGDGNTSTLQNPTHTYATPGQYQVCLTATNVCGSQTVCTLVNLNCPVPSPNFSFSNINLAYSFTDLTGGNPTGWFWSFGDGNTSTLQNPNHTYANTGTFQVCLTALNSCGADTFCMPVTVTCPMPAAGFTSSANNLAVSFTDISTNNPTGWQWDFGDGSGTSIQTNPSYTYTTPGTYLVCVTAINGCGSNTFCDSVTVGCPPPAANFSFLTQGPTVNFSDQSAGAPTSWFWDFGDGNSSTLQNPTHTYATTDTFTVCLITGSICGFDTTCQPTIISCVPPVSAFSFNVSSDSIATFTNQASTNTTAFTWDFGDGNTSTAANPTHTYGAPGTYNACLIVTNSCGIDTFCTNVVITCANPTAGYTAQVTNSVASFNNISILAQSYFWDFGDGNTSTAMNPTHTYTTSGIFTVCLTVTNFCGTNTTCQNLVIACNAPVPAFSFVNGTASVSFSDQSQNNPTSWFWDFGDGGTDTVANPTHTFLFTGQFLVCLRATNACGSMDTCSWVTVTAVGTDEEDLLNSSLQIYPNPGSGLFAIETELPKAMDLRFRVTNTLGQEVVRMDEGRRVGAYSGEIDLRQFAAGTYILEITAGEHRIYRNLVKQ